MKNLAIIPARSGSKALPNKNIKSLHGKPLLAYSIDAAKESGLFDEIMVSTDSESYAQIALDLGASVPFLRSAATSSDTASSWDAVIEALENYKKLGRYFDTVCLLQPTSPLRRAKDIKTAYELYEHKNADTVIAVCEAEHSPLWMNTLPESLSMDSFVPAENDLPRQKLEQYYRINGAIYITNTDKLTSGQNIYINSYAYVMDKERSVDIDTAFDFELAEFMMEKLD